MNIDPAAAQAVAEPVDCADPDAAYEVGTRQAGMSHSQFELVYPQPGRTLCVS